LALLPTLKDSATASKKVENCHLASISNVISSVIGNVIASVLHLLVHYRTALDRFALEILQNYFAVRREAVTVTRSAIGYWLVQTKVI
jgi:hypothetical protein